MCNYAGNASTIKRNFGLTDEEANRIYNAYMSGFDGLKRYQDRQKKQWWRDGFIDLNPLVGYKARIYDYEYLKKLQASFQEPGFWDYYREMKQIDPKCDTVMKVKEFFKRRSDSDRQAVNYPIQHTGALCYKVSMINFFEYLRQNDLLFKVFIPVTPYDEINCEVPEEIAEDVAQVLYEIMVKAGAYFCTRCKLDADVSRLSICLKDFYWEGQCLAKEGDFVHVGEDSFYNVTQDIRYEKKVKYEKGDFSGEGPLPTFWVH